MSISRLIGSCNRILGATTDQNLSVRHFQCFSQQKDPTVVVHSQLLVLCYFKEIRVALLATYNEELSTLSLLQAVETERAFLTIFVRHSVTDVFA